MSAQPTFGKRDTMTCEQGCSRSGAALSRRTFLASAVAGTALGMLDPMAHAVGFSRQGKAGAIDVNVSLSRWPMRRVPCDVTPELVAKLRRQGVTEAWAGSFDGLVHKDLAGVNARLAEGCRRQGRGLLKAFGSVNPTLPDWEEELRRCAEVHRMPGIRLHPNYHGYKLDDPAFARLLTRASERRMILQIAVIMEDERMMHPLLRVPPVDVRPLTRLVKEIPSLRLVLLNALGVVRGPALAELLAAGNICVEISMLEGVAGIEKLLQQVPLERVLFGSHAPLFYFESALLKLRESPLSQAQLDAIRFGNARLLLRA